LYIRESKKALRADILRAPIPCSGRHFSTNPLKTSPLFWDIPDSLAVWLSGAIPKREMTANRPFWLAKHN
jgi:hypothetical protein